MDALLQFSYLRKNNFQEARPERNSERSMTFALIALINFWLKGAGILKDIGDFNGLPGN